MTITIKKKGGRPTKYNENRCGEVKSYLKECEVKIGEFHKTRGIKSDTFERYALGWLPTYEGLAILMNVNVDTLIEWGKIYPKFSDSLKKLLHIQKQTIIQFSMLGLYNPTIAKLMLSANHGMHEKSETDVTSNGEKITGFNYQTPNDSNNISDK